MRVNVKYKGFLRALFANKAPLLLDTALGSPVGDSLIFHPKSLAIFHVPLSVFIKNIQFELKARVSPEKIIISLKTICSTLFIKCMISY